MRPKKNARTKPTATTSVRLERPTPEHSRVKRIWTAQKLIPGQENKKLIDTCEEVMRAGTDKLEAELGLVTA